MKTILQSIKKLQLNKACLLIAVLHWFLTFLTDCLVFQYVTLDFGNLTQTIKTAVTFGAKAVFLLVLIALWQFLYRFIKSANRKFVRNSLIYFGINIFLLLLCWPGIWRMDEFGILNSAVVLFPVFWQNYLTSVLYIFSLMLIPFPAGVIIVQCMCISLIGGYVVARFEEYFGKIGLLAFVPLFFLPVLDSNLYPMRMSLYAFLELLLLVLLYERQKTSVKKADFWICLLAAVVTIWRTEAIYYFVLFPLLLFILWRKSETKKHIVRAICAYLVLALCLFVPQKVGDKFLNGNQYDLTAVVLPLAPLVEQAYVDNAPELEAIDQVIDVSLTAKGVKEGKSGINLFWSEPGFQKEGYTDVQYAQFKRAYYQLIIKYPDIFFKERLTCFLQSQDLLENTTELYTKEGVANYETFRNYPLSTPISNEIRTATIKVLELRDADDYNRKLSSYSFVYGPIVPILLLLFAWVLCLIRKKWAEFFLVSLPLVKVPLIFLTAPSRLFMYYYSLYLIGYFVLIFVAVKGCDNVWKKVGSSVLKTIRYAKRNGVKAAYYAAMERIDHTHTDALTKKAMGYVGCKEWSVDSTLSDESSVVSSRSKQLLTMQSRSMESLSIKPLISIVVPTYETKEVFLRELLECVIKQTYSNWELVLADASKTDAVKRVVDDVKAALQNGTGDSNQRDHKDYNENGASLSARIRYLALEKNAGISDNTNVAIEAATGDYIALLDHDDLLTYDALMQMVSAIDALINAKREQVVFVYSDEDKCNSDATQFYEPYYKPDFNLDLLLSNNYICHFLMIKADVLKAHKLRAAYDGAQDYDLVLRLSQYVEADKANRSILHVPSILYHWRCHEASTAINTDSKRYAYDAGREALKAYYKAAHPKADIDVMDSSHLGFYTTTYSPDIFAIRKDVAAICGRVIQKGIVIASPDDLFTGLRAYSSGYMHRADLYMEVTTYDERAVLIRPDLDCELKEALAKGMKLLYDPNYIKEI